MENSPAPATTHRAAFFRQSGWLMIASIAGGMFMWAAHFLSKAIPEGEYGVFVTLLAVAMCVPTMPLQMVLAQQTARALATHREKELAGMIRLVWLGTFVLWLAAAAVALVFQHQIMERWSISAPAAVWVTLPVVLLSLLMPMFSGMLQGQQNFMWLGWIMIIGGVGRVGVAALAVWFLHAHPQLLNAWPYSVGMMTGVLLGLGLATGVGIWQTRRLWLTQALPFDWRALLRQVIPLVIGFGVFQFLFTADTMFVKAYFTSDQTGFYGSAGTLSRALMWLVGPLASVMFPRIVHSAAKAEKTDLMGLVLIGTAVMALVGAGGLAIVGPLLIKIVYKASYVETAAAILPWYALAMIPLTLANVLLNNLLARSLFKVVPALCVLAIVYPLGLSHFHASLQNILQVMGVCNLLLLGICSWYTWGPGRAANK